MSPPRPAYVESIDEDSGRTVKGSRRSAKEKSKEKKQRSDKSKRSPQVNYLPAPPPPLKERAVREKNIQVVTEREVKHERRNSTSSTSPLSPRKHQRPPLAHENSHQADKKTKDDPSHFGRVQSVPRPALPVLSQSMQNTLVHPQPARPRAATSNSYPRPVSFHATQNGGPPLSNSAWANYQPTQTYTYSSSPNYSQTPQYPQYSAPTPPPGSDYFGAQPLALPERPLSTRPLSSRFEAPARTASGFGMRDALAHDFNPSYDTGYHDDGYASSNNGAVVKRISIREPSRPKRMSRDYHDSQTYHDSQEDYHEPQTYHDAQSYHDSQTMPPPPQPRPILRRPWTEQAISGEYPPHDSYRDDRDERSEERSMIRDPSRPRRASTRRRKSMVTYELPDHHDHDEDHEPVRAPRTRRSDSLRQPKHAYDDIVTDLAEMDIETANNSRRRRSSVYGTSTTHSEPKASTKQSDYEDKIRQAANYQEDVAGPNIPLTAEVLKKQEKQRRKAGSSQSTKSSHSRDESDYKKSVTTRTTRSGSGDNDENLTIKLKGTTRLIVGGAQIECDGGEIEIKRQGTNGRFLNMEAPLEDNNRLMTDAAEFITKLRIGRAESTNKLRIDEAELNQLTTDKAELINKLRIDEAELNQLTTDEAELNQLTTDEAEVINKLKIDEVDRTTKIDGIVGIELITKSELITQTDIMKTGTKTGIMKTDGVDLIMTIDKVDMTIP
ncbi:hypothetical protein HYFRA_00014184 [Hymenoscyphus fraxineus]|uniref:Uncharacterized protein n=1 Tax=Hymenoscyphus fraxineus TaxID=746836 RepID=A0A9N9LB90_9HELO|nr:hypothetical protein HYFRA_00014184 [Hymenoscyphus fraxineus]